MSIRPILNQEVVLWMNELMDIHVHVHVPCFSFIDSCRVSSIIESVTEPPKHIPSSSLEILFNSGMWVGAISVL